MNKRKPELFKTVPVSGSNVECRLKASTKTVYRKGAMKSKNIKTTDKKNAKAKAKPTSKKVSKPLTATVKPKKEAKAKGENKNKKFFPKNAKTTSQKKSTRPAKVSNRTVTPLAKTKTAAKKPVSSSTKSPTKVTDSNIAEKVVVKRAPWVKKPVENIHSTPANAGYSMRSEFDKYIAKKYKRLKDDQIKSLWVTVSNKMLAEPNLKLLEVVDNCLTKK